MPAVPVAVTAAAAPAFAGRSGQRPSTVHTRCRVSTGSVQSCYCVTARELHDNGNFERNFCQSLCFSPRPTHHALMPPPMLTAVSREAPCRPGRGSCALTFIMHQRIKPLIGMRDKTIIATAVNIEAGVDPVRYRPEPGQGREPLPMHRTNARAKPPAPRSLQEGPRTRAGALVGGLRAAKEEPPWPPPSPHLPDTCRGRPPKPRAPWHRHRARNKTNNNHCCTCVSQFPCSSFFFPLHKPYCYIYYID